MKKLIALTLAILLLAGCAPAVYEGPTETTWVLTEMTTTFYNAVTGEPQTIHWIHSYDSFGNEVRTHFFSDGELTEEYKRTYDDRGNCISSVYWDHSGLIALPRSRTRYTYDDQDRLLTTTYRNGFGLKTGADTYTYDDEANTITWDGTYDTRTTYLNENGDPLQVVTYSEPAAMEMETRYEYDDRGRNTRIAEYRDGELASYAERSYDEQDRLLNVVWYDADGTILMSTGYAYEENTVTSRGHQGDVTIQVLRPDGQVETQEYYGPDGKLRSRTENIYTQIQVPAKEE